MHFAIHKPGSPKLTACLCCSDVGCSFCTFNPRQHVCVVSAQCGLRISRLVPARLHYMPSDHRMSSDGSTEAQTSTEGAHAERSRFTQISAWTGGLIGFAALAGGAFLTGSSHWAASAKALREEGVDPKLRLQALPVAAKALGYTSLVALVLGGAAVVTMQHVFDARDVTEVSSLADAIALAKRQRTAVQQEFAKRIDGSRDDGKPP